MNCSVESAEARLGKLHWQHKDLLDAFDLQTRIRDDYQQKFESANSKLSRVMEWMRGQCECCGNNYPPYLMCQDCEYHNGLNDNWTPPINELEG